ncbi:MAG: hypothetical protein HW403_1414 [Dehalococcoidia bacterium]|nr:hypothetical protein [Dehalococcoidia bacterium]
MTAKKLHRTSSRTRGLRLLLAGAALSILVVLLALRLEGLGLAREQNPSEMSDIGPLFGHSEHPVLETGQDGSWDSGSIHAPSVVKVGDRYLMWYDGTSGNDPYAGWSIGLAWSTEIDSESWVKHPDNPVLIPGSQGEWDSVSVHDPRVIYDEGFYRMWYSGYDGHLWRIGYATSTDGVVWTKHPANPVMHPGAPGEWDASGVAYSSVLFQGGLYRMWYQGLGRDGAWRIGYATSKDGLLWEKHSSNPVVATGPGDSWDGQKVMTPHVVKIGAQLVMFYTGAPLWGIGYATSKDGVQWQKMASNPIIASAPPGSWDSQQAITVTAWVDKGALRLWYAGGDGRRFGIGQVSAPLAPSP